jgi:hypothetical protein
MYAPFPGATCRTTEDVQLQKKDCPVASNDIPIEEFSITDWYYYMAVILFNTVDYFRLVVLIYISVNLSRCSTFFISATSPFSSSTLYHLFPLNRAISDYEAPLCHSFRVLFS